LLRVPESWQRDSSRWIELSVMVVPAKSQGPSDQAVFVLTGGPGQAATDDAIDFATGHAATLQARDLVLVDQRGTGRSNPLRCSPPDPELTPDALRAYGRRCLAELSRTADVRFYTTPYAAADLEAVRRALHYERVDLDGGSYGTRLALVYLRMFPSRVRTMALRGVSPPDFRNPLPFSRAGQRALDRLAAECMRDDRCRAAFPRMKEELDAVLARLEAAPAVVRVKPGSPSGGERELRIGRDRYAQLVHLMLFVPGLVDRLPYLIHRSAGGDLVPFGELAIAFEDALVARIAFGLQLAVVCPEDLARITARNIAEETPGTFLGDRLIRDFKAICSAWPDAGLPPDFWEDVTSPVPSLLLASEYDPSTPTWLAERVARHLSRSKLVVLPGATHLHRSACLDGAISRFIESGGAAPVPDCLGEPARREFLIDPAAGPR
jgi:pimeloyl-ACP methyl ester carboxylesterase